VIFDVVFHLKVSEVQVVSWMIWTASCKWSSVNWALKLLLVIFI